MTIDFEKAFDMVSWDFIKCLQSFNFEEVIQRWV